MLGCAWGTQRVALAMWSILTDFCKSNLLILPVYFIYTSLPVMVLIFAYFIFFAPLWNCHSLLILSLILFSQNCKSSAVDPIIKPPIWLLYESIPNRRLFFMTSFVPPLTYLLNNFNFLFDINAKLLMPNNTFPSIKIFLLLYL